eukprot:Lithocolla_globosa_v1_NODE_3470_length_1661_cov_21.199875.p3 type:complete len:104 gc:universal NODE_3470_length_1661_cov_21.199875:448-137(-)
MSSSLSFSAFSKIRRASSRLFKFSKAATQLRTTSSFRTVQSDSQDRVFNMNFHKSYCSLLYIVSSKLWISSGANCPEPTNDCLYLANKSSLSIMRWCVCEGIT